MSDLKFTKCSENVVRQDLPSPSRALARRSRIPVENRKRIIEIEAKRLGFSEAIFTKVRGLSQDRSWPDDLGVGLRYDLNKLRASEDFIYATHNAIHVFAAAQGFYKINAQEFEKFLGVQEEYE